MAILPSAIWRIRPGGSTANGAAFDPTISGAGTDYSQQDAAQLTLTDLNSSGITITSATGGFTSAMIGNALQTAAGAFYFIVGYTNTNTISVDRSVTPSLSGSSGRIGGAWGGSSGVNPFFLADNTKASTSRPAAGSTIYIRGSGTDTPGSADYAFTGTTNALNGYAIPVSGSVADGLVRFVGENGRPRIHGSGLMVSATRASFENFYIYATAASNPHTGMFRLTQCSANNIHFNTNGQAAVVGVGVSGGILSNCEVWSGTTSPSTSSFAYGVRCPNSGGGTGYHAVIYGCKIHHMGDSGVYAANPGQFSLCNNWIYGNKQHGVVYSESDQNNGWYFDGNVVNGNTLDGINILNATSYHAINTFVNNIISNNNQTSRFGVNVAAGSAATIASLKKLVESNFYYNNTTNRSSNFSASSSDVDLTVDPFVDASTFDFRLNGKALGGNLVRKAGFPKLLGTYPQSTGGTRSSFRDGGATQEKNTPTLLVSGF